jgi:hypothetical protein
MQLEYPLCADFVAEASDQRSRAPNRYTWEIRPGQGLAVEESRIRFASWEEASQAGKRVLEMLNARHDAKRTLD